MDLFAFLDFCWWRLFSLGRLDLEDLDVEELEELEEEEEEDLLFRVTFPLDLLFFLILEGTFSAKTSIDGDLSLFRSLTPAAKAGI